MEYETYHIDQGMTDIIRLSPLSCLAARLNTQAFSP